MQIIVLGMHRSGTSAITRLVNLLGANIGDPAGLIPAAADNRKGFWEQREVALLNDAILDASGQSWDRICRVEDLELEKNPEAERRIQSVIAKLDQRRPWVLKDPRFSLTLPCWARHLEQPLFILVVRHPLEVASSIHQRNGLPFIVGLGLWQRYLEHANSALRSLPGARVVVVDLHRVQTDPAMFAAELFSCLEQAGVSGLRQLPESEARSWFDERLVTPAPPSLYEQYGKVVEPLAADYAALAGWHLSAPAWKPLQHLHVLDDVLAVWSDVATYQKELQGYRSALLAALPNPCESHTVSSNQEGRDEADAAANGDPLAPAQGAWDLKLQARALGLARTAYHESRRDLQEFIDHLRSGLEADQVEARRAAVERRGELESISSQLKETTVLVAQYSRDLGLARQVNEEQALQLREAEAKLHVERRRQFELEQEVDALRGELELARQQGERERSELRRDAERQHEAVREGLFQVHEAHMRLAVASKQLLDWMDETICLQRATFRSFRWQIGSAIGRLGEILLFRFRPHLARDDLAEIESQFLASRDGVVYAHIDTEKTIAGLIAALEPEGVHFRVEDDASAQPAERGISSCSGRRPPSQTARPPSRLLSRLSAMAVTGAKWIVHRLIDVLPIGAVRREALRLRIFDLQQALLAKAPNSAVLADLAMLAEHRLERPFRTVTPGEILGAPVELDLSLVLFRSEAWLGGFFTALAESTYPLECVHLLVTDHSPGTECAEKFESTISPIRARFASVRYERAKNAGFGHGHNRNLQHARTGLFLVCNVDGELHRDALANVVAAAQSSSGDVVAWELRQIPYEHPKYYDPVTREVSWVSGASVMLRADALRAVGGFEPRIFMYGEDVELSYRLRSHGGRLQYVPKAVMRHETYAEVNEFKPLQFLGSTLANAYLRLRYGRRDDILSIPARWASLLPVAMSKGLFLDWLRYSFKLVGNAPYFLLTRPTDSVRVPFSGWDYGLRRTGAFHYCSRPVGESAPKVSIITRTHGQRHAILRQAIISVANQTWPNIELIVVEDGGSAAESVCAEMAELTGLEIRHVPLPKRGRCHAGNAGLEASTGELLGFLDDDDLLFADHVETLACVLNRHPEIGAAYGLSWEVSVRIDETTGASSEVMHRTVPEHCQPFSRDVLAHHNFMPIQAPLFRRELFDEYRGFDPDLEILEDWDLWRRYSYRHDFIYVEKTTSIYHVPADRVVAATRQLVLDEFYQVAKARYERFEEAQRALARRRTGTSA